MDKIKKIRLDQLLVERKIVESRQKAQAMIFAGKVAVNGETVLKPATKVGIEAQIVLKENEKYCSRGGVKLEFAIEHFGIDPKNKICLDIGSSTGGFVDCLLQFGAKKVYAVDVGKGLLHYKLRNDPRVISIENTNFRYFQPEKISDKIDLITIDVSFISLEKILPKVKEIAENGTEILPLVKPQFETERKYLKKGVIRDTEIQLLTVEKIKSVAISLGFKYVGNIPSPIKGPKGNTEYFLYLRK